MKEALIQQKEIQDEAGGQNANSFFAVAKEEYGLDMDGSSEDIDDFDGFSETQSHYEVCEV